MTNDSLIPRITKPISAYDLLTKVCEVITEEPKRYFQRDWIISEKRNSDRLRYFNAPACGTICCVAGWVESLRVSPQHTAVLSDIDMGNTRKVAVVASRTLGLTERQTRELFSAFAINLLAEKKGISVPTQGTAEYAALGVEHIKRFRRKHAATLRAKIVRPKLGV